MIKHILLVLTAFFRFYYYVLTKNPKQYELAMNPWQSVSSAITPLFVALIAGFCTASFDIYYFILVISIPLILLNMFFNGYINSKGWAIRRERERMQREKDEAERREYRRTLDEHFKRMMEENARRREQQYEQYYRQRQSTARPQGNSRANAIKLLSLGEGFTEKDVKSAYRRLSKVHHPDVAGGSEENFKRLNKAYNYLLENM